MSLEPISISWSERHPALEESDPTRVASNLYGTGSTLDPKKICFGNIRHRPASPGDLSHLYHHDRSTLKRASLGRQSAKVSQLSLVQGKSRNICGRCVVRGIIQVDWKREDLPLRQEVEQISGGCTMYPAIRSSVQSPGCTTRFLALTVCDGGDRFCNGFSSLTVQCPADWPQGSCWHTRR